MKTIVVTGATSGIGLAVCGMLLRHNYRIIGIGRCESNCIKAKEALSKSFSNSEIIFFHADLLQQSEIKRVSDMIIRYLDEHCDGKLYALINNAGCVRSWYSTSEDGYEQQFALNHLAPFLLTFYLMPYLLNGAGRVLITSSKSHKLMKIHWKDIMYRERYNPLFAYKQSKLCNMLFVYELSKRFRDQGLRAYGIDPGLVATDIGLKQTGGLVKLVWSFRKKHGVDPEVPALTYSWLCNTDPAPDNLYFYKCKYAKYSKEVNSNNSKKLFELSQQLCGIDYNIYIKA